MTTFRSGFALTVGALLLAVAGSGFAAETESSPPASIPFANHGGIRDWRADRDQGLWVQDTHRQWYYATFMSTCLGLNFAQTIAFDTQPSGRFDRFSSIFVPGPSGGRCTVQTFTKSGAPPSGKAKADRDKAKAGADADQPSARKD
jgi:hypothetical protein